MDKLDYEVVFASVYANIANTAKVLNIWRYYKTYLKRRLLNLRDLLLNVVNN